MERRGARARGNEGGGNNGGLTGGITGRAGVAAGNLPLAGTVPQPRAGVGAERWEGVPGEGGAALCAGLCSPLTSAAAPGLSGAGGGGSGGRGGMSPGSGMLLPRRSAGSGGFLRPRRLLLLLLLLLPRSPPPAPPRRPPPLPGCRAPAEPPSSPRRSGDGDLGGSGGGSGGRGRERGETKGRAGPGTAVGPTSPAPLRTPDRAQAPRGSQGHPKPGLTPPLAPRSSFVPLCFGGVPPHPKVPPALQSPLPCSGPGGTRGVPEWGCHSTGVPQTHRPRALPAPTWALPAGHCLPCPWPSRGVLDLHP